MPADAKDPKLKENLKLKILPSKPKIGKNYPVPVVTEEKKVTHNIILCSSKVDI